VKKRKEKAMEDIKNDEKKERGEGEKKEYPIFFKFPLYI
jgi:hypothetical protein